MTSVSCSATQFKRLLHYDISQIVKHLFLISGSQVGPRAGLGHKPTRGGGFCVYADITIAIRLLFDNMTAVKRVMIIDLDAHQVRFCHP